MSAALYLFNRSKNYKPGMHSRNTKSRSNGSRRAWACVYCMAGLRTACRAGCEDQELGGMAIRLYRRDGV